MGRFTEAHIESLSDQEVAELERLMEANDRDVFDWIAEMSSAPANYDTPLLRRIRAFHHAHPTAI